MHLWSWLDYSAAVASDERLLDSTPAFLICNSVSLAPLPSKATQLLDVAPIPSASFSYYCPIFSLQPNMYGYIVALISTLPLHYGIPDHTNTFCDAYFM